MFNKYYQDELAFLRESGREFADVNPEAARFLAEAGTDPDVERMLEGFAFLTAKLRQKLDDELPEFTHAFTQMFWPHYLRPIPATTILQFEPSNKATAELKQLKRGIEIDSKPVDGTRCRFRTCYDFDLVPLDIAEVDLRREAPARLRVQLTSPPKMTLDKLGLRSLRFHLAGSPAVTRNLYVSMLSFVKRVVVRRGKGGDDAQKFELPPERLKPVGFGEDQAVLDGAGPSFGGYRLLQEYFATPAKYMFVELTGLDGLAGFEGENTFTLDFEFSRLPDAMPPVSKANLLLNCVPAVNRFKHDADPVRLLTGRTEYTLRPAGESPTHFEIYSVDKVSGLEPGTGNERVFLPQFDMTRRGGRNELFYSLRRQDSVAGRGSDMLISFIEPQGTDVPLNLETVSIELTCTNSTLPSHLDAGDVSVKTQSSPIFAKYRNITRPTPTVPPPLHDDIQWRLISHLSLNYMSLLSADALRSLVGLYNFRARLDRQTEQAHTRLLEGIQRVEAAPASRLFNGSPVRGLDVNLTLDEELVGGVGEMFLFGSVLNEFFAQYVSLNAFSRLHITGAKFSEEFQWPARIGRKAIL
jgi:type VI secretion system protein ImpG